MPITDNAKHSARYRLRKAGKLPPVAVCGCGRKATGAAAPLCRLCWLKTDAGREWNRLRLAQRRSRSG